MSTWLGFGVLRAGKNIISRFVRGDVSRINSSSVSGMNEVPPVILVGIVHPFFFLSTGASTSPALRHQNPLF